MHAAIHFQRLGVLAASVAGIFLSAPARAGEPDEARLAETFVTAARHAQAVDTVNATVQVVGREEIRRHAGRSLSEVLQDAHGVYVKDSGSSSSISLRGFDASQTLVLVDGLKRTEKYGGSNLNNIQLEDIERIEIVRGPMSALYGADALGGVVNVITRKAQGKPEFGLRATYGGTDDGQRASTLVSGYANVGDATLAHRLSFESKRREPYTLPGSDPRTTDLNEERRDFLAYQGQARLPAGRLEWGAEALRQDDSGRGLTALPAVAPYRKTEREDRLFAFVGYSGALAGGELALRAAHGDSDASVNRGTAVNETTRLKETQFEGQYTFEPGNGHLATVGYAYRSDDADISTNSRRVERIVNAVFAQTRWQLAPAWSLDAGLRRDDYNDFGAHVTPRLGVAWRQGAWTLRGGYGEGFKAPSLLNMYMSAIRRGRYEIVGNPDLKPEESRSVELAAAYRFAGGGVEAVAHRSAVDNLIGTAFTGVSCGSGCTQTRYLNVDRATLRGVELSGHWRASDWLTLTGGIDYLRAENADTGARLTDRARWVSRLGARIEHGAWGHDLRLRRVDGYYAGNPNVIGGAAYEDGQTVLSLRSAYALDRRTELFVGVDNLFDRAVPVNMSTRGAPDDPGARYVYAGIAFRM